MESKGSSMFPLFQNKDEKKEDYVKKANIFIPLFIPRDYSKRPEDPPLPLNFEDVAARSGHPSKRGWQIDPNRFLRDPINYKDIAEVLAKNLQTGPIQVGYSEDEITTRIWKNDYVRRLGKYLLIKVQVNQSDLIAQSQQLPYDSEQALTLKQETPISEEQIIGFCWGSIDEREFPDKFPEEGENPKFAGKKEPKEIDLRKLTYRTITRLSNLHYETFENKEQEGSVHQFLKSDLINKTFKGITHKILNNESPYTPAEKKQQITRDEIKQINTVAEELEKIGIKNAKLLSGLKILATELERRYYPASISPGGPPMSYG